ncbi:hypothetical protein [Oceanobacillus profundus]|uniref:hypothetical protein n=1 Tax=Oceanobacillus profundus TaxID=372463 RepID=UPI00195F89E5|nr:hypothetical protein [Oceanobacillus profundus]
MLKPALLFKDQLESKFIETAYEEKYKYYVSNNYVDFELNLQRDSWTAIEFVSIDKDNNLLGFLGARIDRNSNSVSSLSVINFYDVNYTFSKDFRQFLDDLLFKFNFNKIKFSVVVGNPAEKMYDKYVEHYGGRIVGIFKEHVVLTDNHYYDWKTYEVFRKDVLNKRDKKGVTNSGVEV